MKIYSILSGKKIAVKLTVLVSMSCAVLAFSSYASHATGLQPLEIDPVTGNVVNLDVNDNTINDIGRTIDNDMQQLDYGVNRQVINDHAAQRRRILRDLAYTAPEEIATRPNLNGIVAQRRRNERVLRNLGYMPPEILRAYVNNAAPQGNGNNNNDAQQGNNNNNQ